MIELMKFDMGGAGAVFGAAQIIADLKPEGVEVRQLDKRSTSAFLRKSLAASAKQVVLLIVPLLKEAWHEA